jgi:3-deoxy-D-manno-octulosonic acid kinase
LPNEASGGAPATGADSLTQWHRAVERLNVETCEAADRAFARGERAGGREFLWQPLRAFAAQLWGPGRGVRLSHAVLAGYWMLARAAKLWEADTRWREENLETLVYGRSVGIVRREWIVTLERLLDGEGAGDPVGGGRGGTLRVVTEQGAVIVRRFRRGGAVRWLGDRYFGFRPRPVREFFVLLRARRRGLPVPEPVAALVNRRGVGYRGMLVMREIGDATPLSALVDRGVDFDLALGLADSLRELHEAGLDHPDLNLGNMLLRARSYGSRLAFVDLDRARLHVEPLGRRARTRNLRRFRRSALKLDPGGRLLPPSELDRLEARYWSATSTAGGIAEERGATRR